MVASDGLKAGLRYIRKRENTQVNILNFYCISFGVLNVDCQFGMEMCVFIIMHSIGCLFTVLLTYPPGCLLLFTLMHSLELCCEAYGHKGLVFLHRNNDAVENCIQI